MTLTLFPRRRLFCTVLLLTLCTTCFCLEYDLPSVVVPQPDAARERELQQAEVDAQRKAEHERAGAEGVPWSYLATVRGRNFGKRKDAVDVLINGVPVPDFVLHNGRELSFVVPVNVVVNKDERDAAFLEVFVNGRPRLKKIPMSIIVLSVRKVHFKAFRILSETNEHVQNNVGYPFVEEKPAKKTVKKKAEPEEEVNEEEKAEYARFADLMQRVDNLLQRKKERTSLKAISLLADASKNGTALAMTTLAALYLSGDYVGVARDFRSAVPLLEEAAGLGNADAQALRGFLFASGIARPHLPKSTGAAILLWQFAAAAGSQFAKIALAYRYFTGTDVLEKCETAMGLYEDVARQVVVDNGRRAKEAKKTQKGAVDIRPPQPQEMSSISRIRLKDEMETHFSNTQQDIVQYYRHSARRGDPAAQVVIGNFYYYGGPGINQDLEQARYLFEQAARAGRMDAHAHLGFMDLHAGRNASAVLHLMKAADAGQKMGHHGLGYAALHGIGIPKNPKLAVDHFQLAAAQKVSEAMYNLGVMFDAGEDVERKPKEAYHFLSQAAGLGHLKAKYMVGRMHSHGIAPATADCSRAVRYFKEVAERGLWNKILTRALRAYEKGEYGNSLYRYLQAAHAGIEVAQYNAAFMYERGETGNLATSGTADNADGAREENVAEALDLYKMCGAQGNREGAPLSMLRVGDLVYEQGTDFEQAALSYGKAAKLMNAEAMFNLGMMHALGRGLKADAYMAKRYFDQARDTDRKAYLPSKLAVFALQYSDSLKHVYEVGMRMLDESGLKERFVRLLEKSGLRRRVAQAVERVPSWRELMENVSTDAVLVTVLLAALMLIVNARQRLVMARQGEFEDDEEEWRGEGGE